MSYEDEKYAAYKFVKKATGQVLANLEPVLRSQPIRPGESKPRSSRVVSTMSSRGNLAALLEPAGENRALKNLCSHSSAMKLTTYYLVRPDGEDIFSNNGDGSAWSTLDEQGRGLKSDEDTDTDLSTRNCDHRSGIIAACSCSVASNCSCCRRV